MGKSSIKINTLIKISKIMSAVCAIFSLGLIIISFAGSDGNAMLFAFAFIFPIAAAVLINCKKKALILTGGIISICVGVFTLINQMIAIFSADNKTSPWIFCVTLTFTLFLLTSGCFVLLWNKHARSALKRYSGIRAGKKHYRRFKKTDTDYN